MKRSVKFIAILMVVMISVATLVGGCSSKAPNQGDVKANEAPKVDEKPLEITYTTYRDLAANDSIVTKKLPEMLKAKGLNVVFKLKEYGTFNPQEWDQKFKVSMSSGEQPCDVM